MAGVEREVALIVRNDDPAATFQAISEKKWIGAFMLEKETVVRHRDTYYDTPWRALKGSKSSLRTREIFDGPDVTQTLVTMKGGKMPLIKGRVEQEFEWPYGEEVLEGMINLFELQPIQIRTNLRTPIQVYSGKKHVAELALDRLTYHFGGILDVDNKVTLYEVEIEAKEKNFKPDDLATPLMKKFPELEVWEHSKLTTGHAIKVAMQVQTDDDNHLTDKSWNALAALLD